MKRVTLLIISLILVNLSFGQISRDTLNYIEITGYAELEIEPDIVFVYFQIAEYNPTTKQKLKIEKQEEELFKILTDIDVQSTEMKIENFSSIQFKVKWKDIDFTQTKDYTIKFTDISKLNKFYEKLALSLINYTNITITKLDNSKMDEFKEQLYEKAINEAYRKAEIVLKKVNKKVGNPLTINEVNITNSANPVLSNALQGKVSGVQIRGVSSLYGSSAYEEYQNISIRNILIAYKLVVKFEIK